MMPTLPLHQGCFDEPIDDLQRVVLLALGIFVFDQAFGIAGAGDVDARRGIAVGGEPHVLAVVAQARSVAAAIGHVFEDAGNRLLRGVLRQEQPRRQLAHRYRSRPDIRRQARCSSDPC